MHVGSRVQITWSEIRCLRKKKERKFDSRRGQEDVQRSVFWTVPKKLANISYTIEKSRLVDILTIYTLIYNVHHYEPFTRKNCCNIFHQYNATTQQLSTICEQITLYCHHHTRALSLCLCLCAFASVCNCVTIIQYMTMTRR